MNNWVDINDEMPKEGVDVLIIYDCCGTPDIDIMQRQAWHDEKHNIHCENSFVGKRGFLSGDVTHWMPIYPLPDQYNESEDE